jgi:hypothetical protein
MSSISLLKDFYDLYTQPTLSSWWWGWICLSAHQDRVWFFILEAKKNHTYIVLCYGTIPKDIAISQKTLYSSTTKKTLSVSLSYLQWSYYMLTLENNEELSHGDFLQFPAMYTMDEEWLTWPYLDNNIGIWVASKVCYENSNLSLIQTIDEEASLQYSKITTSYECCISIDTIRQDTLDEPINYDAIYVVENTSHSLLSSYTSEDCISINLRVWFTLEPDIVPATKKYFILCPIDGGHKPISRVKIRTLDILLSTIRAIILHESR